MIQANEIMVGNWFEHNSNWCFRSEAEPKSFLFQWEERDWYALGECTMSLEDCSPIPLTPDILEKCGFEFKNLMFGGPESIMQYWRNDWFILQKVDETPNFYMNIYNDKEKELDAKVTYLHQLQNLYYALTQTELTINL